MKTVEEYKSEARFWTCLSVIFTLLSVVSASIFLILLLLKEKPEKKQEELHLNGKRMKILRKDGVIIIQPDYD